MKQPKCRHCNEPLTISQEGSYIINWKWDSQKGEYVRSRDFVADIMGLATCSSCGHAVDHASLPKKDGIVVEYKKLTSGVR